MFLRELIWASFILFVSFFPFHLYWLFFLSIFRFAALPLGCNFFHPTDGLLRQPRF